MIPEVSEGLTPVRASQPRIFAVEGLIGPSLAKGTPFETGFQWLTRSRLALTRQTGA